MHTFAASCAEIQLSNKLVLAWGIIYYGTQHLPGPLLILETTISYIHTEKTRPVLIITMVKTILIEELKLKKYKHVDYWTFDHSSCHGAYAEDALNAYTMNMRPGGQQPAMRNTV